MSDTESALHKHELAAACNMIMELLSVSSIQDHPAMNNGRMRELHDRAEAAVFDMCQEAAKIACEDRPDSP